MTLRADEIRVYLQSRFGASIEMTEIRELTGTTSGSNALKQFGYGRPLLVSYRVGENQHKLVFHHIRPNAFGREREDDRIAAVWLDFRTFDRLPRHVPVRDMVIRTEAGKMRSIADARDVLLVTGYCEGQPYAQDLLRIRETRSIDSLDLRRAEGLGRYLASIHHLTHADPALWRRRLRDLIGHGEGIMGLVDSYPPGSAVADAQFLRAIEEMANDWRWRLKPLSSRLAQVHGDFHPYNIVFQDGNGFRVLDRSRGEWGEPADDVSCLSINYIFFSLQAFGRLQGPFETLHGVFWKAYSDGRPDPLMREVIQPWFAWRALVLASPVWYPRIESDVRMKLFTFARTVLTLPVYDLSDVNRYLGGA